MIITIDGPAGSGKTTIARTLAQKIGFFYFDTGAIYRAMTYLLLKGGYDLKDDKAIRSFLEGFNYEIKSDSSQIRYFANNEDVTEKIRSIEVTEHVSQVAALKEVREAALKLTRQFGKNANSVFEGRDMGSVVFPSADLKIFLIARPAVRATRRYLELKDSELSQEEILKRILSRDKQDSTRELAPLVQPTGSHLIDTSDLSIDEVIELIVKLIPPKKL